MVRVMITPLVLKLVGAKLLPIEIAIRDLSKILYGKHVGDMDSSIMNETASSGTGRVHEG